VSQLLEGDVTMARKDLLDRLKKHSLTNQVLLAIYCL
jgi:hypothetical protein